MSGQKNEVIPLLLKPIEEGKIISIVESQIKQKTAYTVVNHTPRLDFKGIKYQHELRDLMYIKYYFEKYHYIDDKIIYNKKANRKITVTGGNISENIYPLIKKGIIKRERVLSDSCSWLEFDFTTTLFSILEFINHYLGDKNKIEEEVVISDYLTEDEQLKMINIFKDNISGFHIEKEIEEFIELLEKTPFTRIKTILESKTYSDTTYIHPIFQDIKEVAPKKKGWLYVLLAYCEQILVMLTHNFIYDNRDNTSAITFRTISNFCVICEIKSKINIEVIYQFSNFFFKPVSKPIGVN